MLGQKCITLGCNNEQLKDRNLCNECYCNYNYIIPRREVMEYVAKRYNKGIECNYCGNNDYEQLELDHVNPATKNGIYYGQIISPNCLKIPWKVAEFNKAQILCKTCHLIKTGKERSIYNSGINAPHSGKTWITNGILEKFINLETENIPEGWWNGVSKRLKQLKSEQTKGENNGNSILKYYEVTYIYNNPDNLTKQQLADKFNVSIHTIKDIIYNKHWTHITVPLKELKERQLLLTWCLLNSMCPFPNSGIPYDKTFTGDGKTYVDNNKYPVKDENGNWTLITL